MARKSKKKKSGGKRRGRRRVGAIHPALMDTVMMALGVTTGAVVATFGAQGIKSSSATIPAWLGGGAMAAIGVGTLVFVPHSPFVTGAALGAAGVGAALAINETFISLPGIAGVPPNSGLTNAQNKSGYFSRSVGTAGYKGLPKTMGNFSGNGAATVGAVLSN